MSDKRLSFELDARDINFLINVNLFSGKQTNRIWRNLLKCKITQTHEKEQIVFSPLAPYALPVKSFYVNAPFLPIRPSRLQCQREDPQPQSPMCMFRNKRASGYWPFINIPRARAEKANEKEEKRPSHKNTILVESRTKTVNFSRLA